MFTIKFYSSDGYRQRIYEAESFSILRPVNDLSGVQAEITMHGVAGDDPWLRIDIGPDEVPHDGPQRYGKAIIENRNGKTTEIVAMPFPSSPRGQLGEATAPPDESALQRLPYDLASDIRYCMEMATPSKEAARLRAALDRQLVAVDAKPRGPFLDGLAEIRKGGNY